MHLRTVLPIFQALRGTLLSTLADARERARFPRTIFGSHVVLRGGERMTMGRNVFIDHGAYLNPSTVNGSRGFIHLGNDVEIGPYSVLWGGGGLTIGDNVHLGAHVHITTQQGRMDPGMAPIAIDVAPVTIESDVLIYSGAIIVQGIHIGRGAVVAAGAVVTHDVPAGVTVAGTPARTLRTATGSLARA